MTPPDKVNVADIVIRAEKYNRNSNTANWTFLGLTVHLQEVLTVVKQVQEERDEYKYARVYKQLRARIRAAEQRVAELEGLLGEAALEGEVE